jgi:autoinducer 2-degrading protein
MIRVVTLSFKKENIVDFMALFEERKTLIRNFPGCNLLELWQDKDHPHIFYTYSHWQHPDDLENYRLSSLFQDTWTQVKHWFSDAPKAFSSYTMIQLP